MEKYSCFDYFSNLSYLCLAECIGDDPSVQVSSAVASTKLTDAQSKQIEAAIKAAGITAKAVENSPTQILARFANTDEQMKVADTLRDSLGDAFTVALNLAPTTPSWLRALGAQPMYLGLDLRGGVHFLLEVDMDAAVKQAEETLCGRYTFSLARKQSPLSIGGER